MELLGDKEEEEMWNYFLIGTEFVVKKFWKWIVVTVVQLYKCS